MPKERETTTSHSSPTNSELPTQGALVEIEITDLSHSGEGVGRIGGRVVFVPDTVTGDRALIRLLRVKSQYARGQLKQLLQPSPQRIRPRCIVADKCGGCQWQHIADEYQQLVKRELVKQNLQRIGNFTAVEVAPILADSYSLGYRNKAIYPLGRSPITGNVQAGYYRQGSHQLVNLNQCPVQDPRLNPLLAEVKRDIQQQGWSIYNEKLHRGKLRHLALRIGRHTGEILLTLVSAEQNLPGIEAQADIWLQRYSQLVGVCLNHNPAKTNTIFGRETQLIKGRPYICEKFAGLELQLQADTFFQVNTEMAEASLAAIEQYLQPTGSEILLDAYCGIGTFTLPLAKKVSRAIGIEVFSRSVEQARSNARINKIENVEFRAGKVKQLLAHLEVRPHTVILDPPRKGCDRAVIEILRQIKPQKLVYISCQSATLARDLQLLCQEDLYSLKFLQPADFFPQTPHVESVAFLELSS